MIWTVKESSRTLSVDLIFWAGRKKGCTAFHALSSNCKFIDSNCEQLGFRVLAKAGKMIERNFSVRHR